VVTLVVVVVLRRQPIAETRASVGDLLHALRGSGALRWLLLLEVQDLGGDVLFGFLALYLVDTGGLSAATAALGVAVWAGADLAGNAVLLWLLPRIDTLRWLRVSAAAVAVLFVCFQLTPAPVSLVLLALVAGLRAGWYPISQARLYDALPGQSGTAMALSTMASVIGLALPLALGALAAHVGLHDAFWVILIAPLALLLCVPSSECASRSSSSTSTEPSSTPAGSSSPR
jgi:fucose permease